MISGRGPSFNGRIRLNTRALAKRSYVETAIIAQKPNANFSTGTVDLEPDNFKD
jgi:hypothetical protein